MAVSYYSKMQQRCRWQIQGKPDACFQASSAIGVTQETLSSLAADGDSTGESLSTGKHIKDKCSGFNSAVA